MELQAQIVKSGTWFYDGKVPHEVWIVRQNFDYYHDPGYQDEPCLSDDNRTFQVLYAHEGHVISVSVAHKSLDDAISCAEEKCSTVTWDDHRLQHLFHGRYYKLEP